jgi:hypothetical protein
MFVVNEQVFSSINKTPHVAKSAIKDVEFFIKTTNHQFQSGIFENFDKATDRIKTDIEGKRERESLEMKIR